MTKLKRLTLLCDMNDMGDDHVELGVPLGDLRDIITLMQEMRTVLVHGDAWPDQRKAAQSFDRWNEEQP